MDKGFKFSGFHYDDSVDTFVRCHYDSAYICVLFDVANHILNSNTDEIMEFRKRYWLEDTSMSDIMHADWCVLEFDNKTKKAFHDHLVKILLFLPRKYQVR